MTAAQSAVLLLVLSAFLTPILVAVVALIGLARARKTILVLAIVGLLLFLSAEIGSRVLLSLANAGVPVGLLTALQSLGSPMIQLGAALGSVGGILGLIRTAQIRRWRWFGGIFAAMLVTGLGGLFLNYYPISLIIGTQRAFALFYTSTFTIITIALFCASFVAQITYGIFGPDEPTSSQTDAGTAPAAIIP